MSNDSFRAMGSRIAARLLTGRLAFLLGGLLDLALYALAASREHSSQAEPPPPAP
jgi:hypothetical protein